MKSTKGPEDFQIPSEANFILRGQGLPVILIHGLAASLHDWDQLMPALAENGYAAYAVDLLGHGDSAKPAGPMYRMDSLVEHFVAWMGRLGLREPAVVIGHSLGGYVALEYARRFPGKVSGLVLVDPLYSSKQLPAATRLAYAHPGISRFFTAGPPAWLVRAAIDVASLLMGHRTGGLHGLSKAVREQTAVDYLRTAPASYGVLRGNVDVSATLASIDAPALVVWGELDSTLAPASFTELVRRLPKARGLSTRTGHVPHQAEPDWFNAEVLAFLKSLEPVQKPVTAPLRAS